MKANWYLKWACTFKFSLNKENQGRYQLSKDKNYLPYLVTISLNKLVEIVWYIQVNKPD